jgi:hypothetical protein
MHLRYWRRQVDLQNRYPDLTMEMIVDYTAVQISGVSGLDGLKQKHLLS